MCLFIIIVVTKKKVNIIRNICIVDLSLTLILSLSLSLSIYIYIDRQTDMKCLERKPAPNYR